MNAERLLAHFEQISEAPDAVARLRRFILDLAVRGKLVEQDPEDEPAEELLRLITLEKAFHSSNARREKSSRPEPPKPDESPFHLPASWQWVPATYPASSFSEGYKKIQTKEVLETGAYPVVDQGKVFIRGYCNDPSRVIRVDEPLILFGDHTRETKFIDFDFVVGADGVKLLKPIGVLAQYYFLSLRWLPLDSRGYGRHFKLLKSSVIPLPPLAEQHRIVAKVDELMALCDQLEASLQQREQHRERLVAAALQRLNQPAEDDTTARNDARFALQALASITTTPAQIKQLRQAILNLAVRGKLVEQDPEDEPAEELLRLIADDKKLRMAQRRIRAPKKVLSIKSEDMALGLPLSWQICPLGDISLVSDPNPSHRYPTYDGGTVPILSTQEFSGLDGWNPSSAKLVRREFHDYQVDSCNFEPGDIVFARKGRIGLPRFLPRLDRYAFSHTVFIVKPLCGVYPQYLLWALRREAVVDWLTKEMNQNTGVPTLGKDKTERLPIPLPPLAEQHRIVAKVDELMALCDQLEQQLSQADLQRRRLLEAVLAEALVEPDKALASLGSA